MDVVFYDNFSKRENSTKRPPSGGGVTIPCVFKESTSSYSPVLVLSSGPSYGYCYIPLFNAYYYVNNWVAVSATQWEIELELDVLATWKDSIENAYMYCVRSSTDANTYLPDLTYPATTERRTVVTQGKFIFNNSLNNGVPFSDYTVVLGIAQDESDIGSIKYYFLSNANCSILVHALMQDSFFTSAGFSVNDASLALQKNIVSPLDYIKSCVVLPISYSGLDGGIPWLDSTSLTIQSVQINVMNKTIIQSGAGGTFPVISFTDSIHITSHPLTTERGRWVNVTLTDLTLFVPCFGLIQLQAPDFINSSHVNYKVCLDLATGKGDLFVYNDNSPNINSCDSLYMSAQIGAPIQLSQIGHDYLKFLSAGVNAFTGGAMAAMGNWAGAIGSMGTGVGNVLEAMLPHFSSNGSTGSISSTVWRSNLTHRFTMLAESNNGRFGKPLCETLRLTDHQPGFYQFSKPDLELKNCPIPMRQKITSFLESGVYYE